MSKIKIHLGFQWRIKCWRIQIKIEINQNFEKTDSEIDVVQWMCLNRSACSVLSISLTESSLCFCLCGDGRVSVSRPGSVSVCRWDHMKLHPVLWPANILCGGGDRKTLRTHTEPLEQNATSQTLFKTKSWFHLRSKTRFNAHTFFTTVPVQNPKKFTSLSYSLWWKRQQILKYQNVKAADFKKIRY